MEIENETIIFTIKASNLTFLMKYFTNMFVFLFLRFYFPVILGNVCI